MFQIRRILVGSRGPTNGSDGFGNGVAESDARFNHNWLFLTPYRLAKKRSMGLAAMVANRSSPLVVVMQRAPAQASLRAQAQQADRFAICAFPASRA